LNQELIQKYFRGQYSDEELEQILDWFQTNEGRAFLREQIEQDCSRLTADQVFLLYPNIATEKIFNCILKSNKAAETDYMSWIDGCLEFDDEPLWKISCQLEYNYDVKIEFKSDQLKRKNLTADLNRKNLEEALHFIANMLDIDFKKTRSKIIWG
jgi:hypothetical protein